MYSAVWDAEARTVPSFEIAREVTGDEWTSIVPAILYSLEGGVGSRTAILFDNAPITVPLPPATTHACNSSSSEEEKIISSVEPLLLYLRMSLENTKKSVELSGLQVPASGLGIEIFGFEDKSDDVRLRDAAVGSNKCSVVATASVVIVGGGFGVRTGSKMEIRGKLRR